MKWYISIFMWLTGWILYFTLISLDKNLTDFIAPLVLLFVLWHHFKIRFKAALKNADEALKHVNELIKKIQEEEEL